MNKVSGIILGLVILIAIGWATYIFSGRVYMGADTTPGQLEAKVGMKMVDKWIDRVKPTMPNPIAATPENLKAGAKLYEQSCAGCHGDHKNPRSEFGLSMYPPAPQFEQDVPDMTDAENFVVIKHGTRWTGMPAWKKMLNDQQIWTLTTFLSHMKEAEKLPQPAAQ